MIFNQLVKYRTCVFFMKYIFSIGNIYRMHFICIGVSYSCYNKLSIFVKTLLPFQNISNYCGQVFSMNSLFINLQLKVRNVFYQRRRDIEENVQKCKLYQICAGFCLQVAVYNQVFHVSYLSINRMNIESISCKVIAVQGVLFYVKGTSVATSNPTLSTKHLLW